LIDPESFFKRDRDRDDFFSIKPCLKIKKQSLLKKISSRFDDRKLTTCVLVNLNPSRRKSDHRNGFSIKGRLKFFHLGLLKFFQSGFDGKIKFRV